VNLITAGRAFLVSGPHFNAAPHLWFVLTDPSLTDERLVAVMVVTARSHTDATVLLQVGDHPFIRHDSNVDYGGAILVHVSKFERAMASGRCHLQPDMDRALLDRVRKGLLNSSRTVHWLIEHCRPLF
jgi:hypothetical protein